MNVTRENRRRLAAVVSNRSAPQTADPTRVLAAVKRGKQALESLHSLSHQHDGCQAQGKGGADVGGTIRTPQAAQAGQAGTNR